MPTKYSKSTWDKARQRMAELITLGETPNHAAARVSSELGGKPAAGSIMNRYRDGWSSGKHSDRTTDDLREVKANLERVTGELAKVTSQLAETQQANRELADKVAKLREERAHAEGRAEVATEVIKEVADIDLPHHEARNAHGHPSI